jgi:hypothetical protein|tara:strand:- start:49 stop:606 length:558 start_codon:yes stop_codon:yes gene_type:complete
MIYVVDDFLDKTLFVSLKGYLKNFKEIKTISKSFWVMEPPKNFIDYLSLKLSALENKKIENVLCFFRQAKKNQDNEWRIHNDSLIEGQQPDRAAVIYMSDNEKSLNGTAFWSHKTKGHKLKLNTSKEQNYMLLNEANDKSKWNLKSVIGAKENRLISYPCEYFHSKYPNEFKKERIVLVMFYKIK